MSHRAWTAALLLLGSAWLVSPLRQAVLEALGIYLAPALGASIAVTVSVTRLRERRALAFVLLFLASWASSVIALFLYETPMPHVEISDMVVGIGLALLPVLLGTIAYNIRSSTPLLLFFQVAVLGIAAAPLSSIAGLVISILATGEGP